MRASAAVILALGLLAGCATERWSYTRPSTTPGKLDQDLEACRRQAHRSYWFALTRAGRVDQDALTKCMERKGYTAHRDE